MPSARQIAANRRNAAKSTGPRTDAGKRVSSLNAYTHGLTSQILVMTAEQAEAYERFTDAIVQDLRAVGAMEIQIARSIADTEWRINRAAAGAHRPKVRCAHWISRTTSSTPRRRTRNAPLPGTRPNAAWNRHGATRTARSPTSVLS